ncbi:MAG: type 4a pilus biogenesis protein PilO [Desulfobacterales bacterium]|nr:type 4a pilus biogenesis protein PilO [Desulfobacterales bacterium]
MNKINFSLSSIEPLIQKISDLTKLQRILICVGAVGAVIGLFVWLLYIPQIKEQTSLSKAIVEETDKLKQTKASAAELEKYQKLMEEKKAQFNIASKQLPQTDEVPTLLKNISQAGKDAGLAFLLFKPVEESLKNFYAVIPVQMDLYGSFHDLGVFFDRVAGMSRIVNIKSFEMKVAGSDKGKKRSSPIKAVKSARNIAKKGKAPATVQSVASELSISCTAETYKFVEAPPPSEEPAAAGEGKKAKKKGKKTDNNKTEEAL